MFHVIIISQSRCITLQQLNILIYHTVVYNLSLLFYFGIWFFVELKQPEIIAHLAKWWRFDVSDAGLVCQRLSLIWSFTQSISLTRKRRIIVIKTTTQRNHMLSIFAMLLKDPIFRYWLLPRFSLISNTDLKDGSNNFVVSYVSRTVLFFEI